MTEQGLKTKFLEYFVSSAFAFHHHSHANRVQNRCKMQPLRLDCMCTYFTLEHGYEMNQSLCVHVTFRLHSSVFHLSILSSLSH